MAKKTIIIIILVGLICLAIGFIVGSKANGGLFSKTNDLIGSYECDHYYRNGKEASIVIMDDTNIIYLGRNTTYTRERKHFESRWRKQKHFDYCS